MRSQISKANDEAK
jgi:hypothetical protein